MAKEISIKEVDKVLSEIDNKYNTGSPSLKEKRINKSTDILIKKFYQELDSLGLYKQNEDTKQDLLTGVIVSSFKLINVHRKLIEEVNNSKIEYKSVNESKIDLQKKATELQNEIDGKNKQITALNRKLVLINLDIEDKIKAQNDAQQKLILLQKTSKMKIIELECKINQLNNNNQKLKDIIEKNSGSFISKDEIIVHKMQMYKNNEEVYKDTIQKLQDNNRQLLDEILNLKHEVLVALNKN